MEQQLRPVRTFAFLVGLSGVLLGLIIIFHLEVELEEEAFLLSLAVFLAEGQPVVLYTGQSLIIGHVIILTTLFLFGLPLALTAFLLGQVLYGLAKGANHYSLLFNLGQGSLALVAAGAFLSLSPGSAFWRAQPDLLLAYGLSGLVFFAVQEWLGAMLQSLYTLNGLFRRWEFPPKAAVTARILELGLALGITRVYPFLGWSSFLAVLASLVLQPAFSLKFREAREKRIVDRLVVLALQQSGLLAVQRSLSLATRLGEALGLEPEAIKQVRYAVLFRWAGWNRLTYALGQAARPLKRGEWKRMREHPLKAFQIISGVRSLQEVAKILRHHHERYGGGGYPDGLQGQEIPIGSRILSVVEAYEAMTSYRGYRTRSLSHEEAVEALRREAGGQFDPTVVEAFCRVAGEVFQRSGDEREARVELTSTVNRLRQYIALSSQDQRWKGEPEATFPLLVLEEIQDKVTGVMALYDLSRLVNASLNLERVIDTVLRTTARVLRGRTALLLLDEKREVAAVYEINHKGPARQIKLGDNLSSRSILDGKPFAAVEKTTSPNLSRFPVSSFLSVPLLVGGRAIGALEVRRLRPTPFFQEEVNLLSVIASQAALALENARLFGQLESQLKEISELKNFNDLVIQNVSHAILVVDREGWIRLMNPAATAIFQSLGYEAADLLKQPYSEFIRRVGWKSHLLETLATGQPLAVDNSEVWGPRRAAILETRTAPLRDATGQLVGALAFFRDVTALRQMQRRMQEAEKLAAIGELAAGAAHEIRNPLTAIRGFVQLLQAMTAEGQPGVAATTEGNCSGPAADMDQGGIPASSGGVPPLAPVRDYLQVILQEIDHIDRILKEMLVLAKPSHPRWERVLLPQLINEIFWLLYGQAHAQGVTLEASAPPRLPPLKGDAQLLKQAFLNLFTNALQAMPDGGKLRVVMEEDPVEQRVIIRLSDTGIGIPPENLTRIFAPFFTTRESGTGLGLPISQNIFLTHGGSLEVESEVGRGTTFTVTLPLNAEDLMVERMKG